MREGNEESEKAKNFHSVQRTDGTSALVIKKISYGKVNKNAQNGRKSTGQQGKDNLEWFGHYAPQTPVTV